MNGRSMNISRRRFLALSGTTLCALASAGCAAEFFPSPSSSDIPMRSLQWQTCAVGRFLVDLPLDASKKYTAKIWKEEIIWRPDLTPESARQEAAQTAAKYKAIQHKYIKGSTQFINMFDLPGGGIAVHRWQEAYTVEVARMDCYFISQDNEKRIYFFSYPMGSDHFVPAKKNVEALARTLVARDEDDPLPTEPGFVFEGGFSRHTGEWRAERAIVAFKLLSYPGIKGYLDCYGFGTVQKFMFEREGYEERLAAIKSKIDVLRKGDCSLNGIPGQELCAAATEQGRRKYNFDLEAPGGGPDIARPMLVLHMNSDKETEDDGFASDAEAIAVWNAIRDSIRLRPGAV